MRPATSETHTSTAVSSAEPSPDIPPVGHKNRNIFNITSAEYAVERKTKVMTVKCVCQKRHEIFAVQ